MRSYRLGEGIQLALIRHRIKRGDHEAALRPAQRLALRRPHCVHGIVLLADILLFLNRPDEARRIYEQAGRLLDADMPAHRESARFISAYMSIRLVETDAMVEGKRITVGAPAVETIMDMPSSVRSKSLFHLDPDEVVFPRRHASRSTVARRKRRRPSPETSSAP